MEAALIQKIPLFEELTNEQTDALAAHFNLRRYPKNSFIINEGDDTNSIYIILEGRVKVFLNDESGKEVILSTQSAGEYFGEISLFDDGPRSASVMTLEDSQFAILNQAALLNAISECPELSLSIIRGMAYRLRASSQNVKSLALMDVYGRVARILIDLAETKDDGSLIIEESLTYNDIAGRVGASSKMVSRIMQDLKKGGYIRKVGKKHVIERNLPPAW